MDLRQLAYVVAVVDHGGFTRAAEALHVAQPSLSQAIKALETEVGVALFDRVGRQVRLTAAGRALLPAARQALHDVEIAREAVDAVRGLGRGRLDLVSLPTLGVSPVADFIGAFRTRNPDVTVRLVEPDEVGAVAANVAGGESEIGFTELPIADERLVTIELSGQEYVAVHHRSVERGSLVSVPQLAELPLVTTTPGTSTRRLIDEAYSTAKQVLTKKKKDWIALAEGLLEYETLSGDEIKQLIAGNKPARDMGDDTPPSRGSAVPKAGAARGPLVPGDREMGVWGRQILGRHRTRVAQARPPLRARPRRNRPALRRRTRTARRARRPGQPVDQGLRPPARHGAGPARRHERTGRTATVIRACPAAPATPRRRPR